MILRAHDMNEMISLLIKAQECEAIVIDHFDKLCRDECINLLISAVNTITQAHQIIVDNNNE